MTNKYPEIFPLLPLDRMKHTSQNIQPPPDLHCPFCGGEPMKCKRQAATSKKKKLLFKIKCKSCGCQTDEADHPRDAWRAWNSRIAHGHIPEGAEILR